jgi:hypothetical protein
MDVSSSETHARPTPFHPVDPGGFARGTILANRHRIVSLAGRGGMGEVYRADDLKLGQPAARPARRPVRSDRSGRGHRILLSILRTAPLTLDPGRW